MQRVSLLAPDTTPLPIPLDRFGSAIGTTVSLGRATVLGAPERRACDSLWGDSQLEEDSSLIFGAHVIVFSNDASADRAFFRDVLGYPSVDAGHDWLIFALPPTELAVHPADDQVAHELYLMC